MLVLQLMTRSIVTCGPRSSLDEAAGKMWEKDVGCLPVVDGAGHVIGMLTDRDACMAAHIQGLPLRAIVVESAMARKVISCRPRDTLDSVLTRMKENQVRRLPVIDEEDHLVGIIAMGDLARECAHETPLHEQDVKRDAIVGTLARICELR